MKNIYLLAIALFTVLTLSSPVNAGPMRGNGPANPVLGNEGANGGDNVALEFRQAFASALTRAREKLPSLYKKMQAAELLQKLDATEVLVTDEPLVVKRDGIFQDSIAINTLAPRQIIVNRARWNEVEKNEIKEALSVHEVASIAGLEATGKYPLSGEYLTIFSLEVNPQFDFTPFCGRFEAYRYRRAISYLEVGETTRFEVTEAGLELQQKLLECGSIKKKDYCEVALPLFAFVLEVLREEKAAERKTQWEVDNAKYALDYATKDCDDLGNP